MNKNQTEAFSMTYKKPLIVWTTKYY
jgi:hypothetical protein